jgi:hypothetical protein
VTAYWVDDGGSNTAPFDTLAKAATSWDNLVAGVAAALTTSGNIVYCGHDHNDPNKAASWAAIGPTSGLPVSIISVDSTNATPTYMVGTGNQFSSLGGAYTLTFDGVFALYGVKAASGTSVRIFVDSDESLLSDECRFVLGAGSYVYLPPIAWCLSHHRNLTIDLSADAGTPRSTSVFDNADNITLYIEGLSFVAAGDRTGTVFNTFSSGGAQRISGVDCSGFTNATLCELFSPTNFSSQLTAHNCKTAATWAPFASGTFGRSSGRAILTNVGPADAPTYLYLRDYFGVLVSTADIYRTSGGTVEDIACSWLITTTANCAEGAPFYSPWMYGTVEAGSRTFDLYITNDTADFTDAEVWLEVEYLSTADEPQWALATDQRATITTTAAAQTDDTASTWNGSGPSFTYKQKLSVAATVGESGQFRARVAVGKASIASSRYFYCDPLASVT